MSKFKSYRYRLYPTQSQKVLLNQHFGCTRWIYNYFLGMAQNEKNFNCFSYQKILPELKKEQPWLKEVNSQSLQSSLKNLESSFKGFWNKKSRYPKFKSKRHKNTFKVPQNLKVQGNYLFIPKIKGGIKMIVHRKMEGRIINGTITRTPTGKYFVSIQCEVQSIDALPKTGKSIGIDLGIKTLVVTSEGQTIKNPRTYIKYQKRLAKAQKVLARRKKGSKRRENQALKVAKIHEKIANIRLDTLHKATKNLVQTYDVICVEDLHVKGMIKNKKLSKHLADASFGAFVQMLEYKCDWYGKNLVKVPRFFASSQICFTCGTKNKITLKDRYFSCCGCGEHLDRDLNAARNIHQEGTKIFAGGTPVNGRGANIRPTGTLWVTGAVAMKR